MRGQLVKDFQMSKQIKHVNLLGVCSTAMGFLAILLQQRGYKITGSNQSVYPPMSELLKENKIQYQIVVDIVVSNWFLLSCVSPLV